MSSLNAWLIRIEETAARTLLAAIVVLVFLAALTRWFDYPIIWSIDIAQLFFGWICFLGADTALRQGRHIGMDVLIRLFPVRFQRTVGFFLDILSIVFLVIVTYYGFKLSIINWERRFNTIEVSYSLATLSVPVGCLLMLRTMVSRMMFARSEAPAPVDDSGERPAGSW